MNKSTTKNTTTCFDVFEQCVLAVQSGELIESVSAKDKEFHFQNWFQKRLQKMSMHFEGSGRNTYPDFCLVEAAEGYEVKALAWPGREKDYDSNSQVPTGYHNGRQIFYVFGRYPADITPYATQNSGHKQYPVIDLVLCHGDFLNADHKTNPNAGSRHRFVAWRLRNQASKPVSMSANSTASTK